MNVTVMAPGERSRAGVPGISVVIPVYRSEKILPELVRRLNEVLPVMAAKREIILVNDCSPDTSWDAILQLAAAHPETQVAGRASQGRRCCLWRTGTATAWLRARLRFLDYQDCTEECNGC